MDTCSKILQESYTRVSSHLDNSFIKSKKMQKCVEAVTLCQSNRAGVRALMAGALAKIHQPKIDVRKPYTEIKGDSGDDCYSGRDYDQNYIGAFITKHGLPCNTTTAFLTPGFRTKNIVLTTKVALEGRPPEMYRDLLLVFDYIQSKRLSSQDTLDETMRLLLIARNKRKAGLKMLLDELREESGEQIPLSCEDIVHVISLHLQCKKASRLPVLMVAAAYMVAEKNLGEKVLNLNSHNAADEQTGAAGDVEIILASEDKVLTSYEMKMKAITKGDIDIALRKISSHHGIRNYIFITTDTIDFDVREYATKMYQETGGVEIAILDCIGFIRHFLHLFPRLRTDFLNNYQKLVIDEPESAVNHALKEAFLSLRHAAEAVN